MIESLCHKHTNLTAADIAVILELQSSLQYMADMMQADIFIDCKTRDPNAAVVVAQGKPVSTASRYKKSVVGQLALRENEPGVLRTLETGIPTRDLYAITQEHITVRQVVTPVLNPANECIAVLISEKDVSHDVATDMNIRLLSETADQLTSSLLSSRGQEEDHIGDISFYMIDAIVVFEEGYAVYANPQAKALYKKLGYLDDIEGMSLENLALGPNFPQRESLSQQFVEEEIKIASFTLQLRYGTLRNRLMMLIRDITEVKEKEKELVLKSYAIQEIHHRVKNNLQTVASLLGLQLRRIEDEKYKAMFRESISRILSIAVTHEILAQDYRDNANIKQIIEKLVYNADYGENIQLYVDGDEMHTDSDKAVSIALVVNELLHNACKHAFGENQEGQVRIQIQKGNVYSSIAVSDNGKGFDKDIMGNTLGYNIVNNIVHDKLLGEVRIESTSMGTTVSFDFKNL